MSSSSFKFITVALCLCIGATLSQAQIWPQGLFTAQPFLANAAASTATAATAANTANLINTAAFPNNLATWNAATWLPSTALLNANLINSAAIPNFAGWNAALPNAATLNTAAWFPNTLAGWNTAFPWMNNAAMWNNWATFPTWNNFAGWNAATTQPFFYGANPFFAKSAASNPQVKATVTPHQEGYEVEYTMPNGKAKSYYASAKYETVF